MKWTRWLLLLITASALVACDDVGSSAKADLDLVDWGETEEDLGEAELDQAEEDLADDSDSAIEEIEDGQIAELADAPDLEPEIEDTSEDASDQSPVPTCTDGIQNQGELDIDCGGPCAACPPSCNDGIQNQDETGVDCGGSCVPCPDENTHYEDICAAQNHVGCYYVSPTGDDEADGQSPATAWASLEKVSNATFSPGDIILFERQGTWRITGEYDSLGVSSSGDGGSSADKSDDNWITYSAYGSGAMPAILGSVALSGWSQSGGNIWRSATDLPLDPMEIYYGSEIFLVTDSGRALWGRHVENEAAMTREGDWTYSGGQVSLYCPENPGLRYASVEAPQARRLVSLNSQDYIAFDGISLRYAASSGIYDGYNTPGYSGFRLSNAEVGYIGHQGSGSAYGLSLRRSYIHVTQSELHDCGRRSISLVLYDNTDAVEMSDILIEKNHFYGGFHTTGVDAQVGNASSGSHAIRNMTIRGNFFEGEPGYDIQNNVSSNHIWFNGVQDTAIYNNVFTYTHGKAIGAMGQQAEVRNIHVYHNTFYGVNQTNYGMIGQVAWSDTSNYRIVNNLFVNDYDYANFDADIFSGDGSLWPRNAYAISTELTDEAEVHHNLFYVLVADTRVINHDGTKYTYEAIPSVFNAVPDFLGGSNTAGQLVSDYGELPFVNPPQYDLSLLPIDDPASHDLNAHWVDHEADDLILEAGSLGVGAGECIDITGISGISYTEGLARDYADQAREGSCDLGAFQAQ